MVRQTALWVLVGILILLVRPSAYSVILVRRNAPSPSMWQEYAQQNGRHERMHRTLKMEATRPAGSNFLQQQAKFDVFVHEFNHERPHEALDRKCPVQIYTPSMRPYQGIGELSYPLHDRTVLVTYCGRICIFKKKINLSTSLAGQAVGIKEVDDGIWLVSFLEYDLGSLPHVGTRRQRNDAAL